MIKRGGGPPNIGDLNRQGCFIGDLGHHEGATAIGSDAHAVQTPRTSDLRSDRAGRPEGDEGAGDEDDDEQE